MEIKEIREQMAAVLKDHETGLLTNDSFIGKLGEQLMKVLGDDYKDIPKLRDNLKALQTEVKNVRAFYCGEQTKMLNGLYDGIWKSAEMARDFGLYVLSAVFGSQKATESLQAKGYILEKDMTAADNAAGGILVPTQIIDGLIMLIKQYGVIRRNALVMPMTSDSGIGMKFDTGLTVYCPGAGVVPDKSSPGFSPIGLSAKEWVTYVLIDNALTEDAAIMIGDLVGELIALAFAQKEDEVGFLGDGTSTYFNYVGILHALAGISGGAKGIIIGAESGTGWNSFDLQDFLDIQGEVHEAADDNVNLKWYCSRKFYLSRMCSLALAQGGSTADEIITGRVTKQKMFLGDPVEFSSAMPRTSAATQYSCFYGNLRRGMILGDRRQQTISQSTHYKFAERQLTILGTERVAITVYGQGTNEEAGTICALKTKT